MALNHGGLPACVPLMLRVSRGRSCKWLDTASSGSPSCWSLLSTNFLLHDREHEKKELDDGGAEAEAVGLSWGKKLALHCLPLHWRAKNISADTLLWPLFSTFWVFLYFFFPRQIRNTGVKLQCSARGNIEIPLDEMKDGLAADQY